MNTTARRAVRAAAFLLVIGVGIYGGLLQLSGQRWPQWMDGRYGPVVPWGMFSADLSCTMEIRADVSTSAGVVTVGRGQVHPGPGEWFWAVDVAWHAYAWGYAASFDYAAAANYAREAADAPDGEVKLYLVERVVRGEDIQERTFAPGEWGQACRT